MAFWITVVRSMLAVALGIALVVQPDKTRPMLANFMGMYWLGTGLLSIRWGIAQRGSRGLAILVGAVGLLAGLGMLGRGLFASWVAEDVMLSLLGIVIVLTGILHVSGRLKARQTRLHQRHWTGALLGIFEIVLGLLLIFSPLERGPLMYGAVLVWALVGGLILLGDALYMRRQSGKEKRAAERHGE